MNNTEEKKLYYKSLAEILYRYLEFILSFDNHKKYSYLSLLHTLNEIFINIINNIEQMEEQHLDSHEAIDKIEEMILTELSREKIIDIIDIKEGLSIKDISNLSIALYLKKFRNSITDELNSMLEIVSSYDNSEAKMLMELINMFKNTVISTSITSTTIDDKLMTYYACKLGIRYHEHSTANMYTFIMLNAISGINETLSRFLDNIDLTDIQMHDVSGHLDYFNSHKDESNAVYPIDDLSACLTNLKANLNAFNTLLRDKNKKVSLQPDVKRQY